MWILEIRRVTDITLGEEKCSVLKPDKSPAAAVDLHVGGDATVPVFRAEKQCNVTVVQMFCNTMNASS